MKLIDYNNINLNKIYILYFRNIERKEFGVAKITSILESNLENIKFSYELIDHQLYCTVNGMLQEREWKGECSYYTPKSSNNFFLFELNDYETDISIIEVI